MELKEIASVSGKGGLFKVVKPSRTGVILESLDKQKKKMVHHNRIIQTLYLFSGMDKQSGTKQ